MTTRDDAIKAAVEAVTASETRSRYVEDHEVSGDEEFASIVYDAVEPIIRADERSYSRTAAAAWREVADVRKRIAQDIEKFRVGLPEVTENYSGGVRSRDDMSWALAMVRDLLGSDDD